MRTDRTMVLSIQKVFTIRKILIMGIFPIFFGGLSVTESATRDTDSKSSYSESRSKTKERKSKSSETKKGEEKAGEEKPEDKLFLPESEGGKSYSPEIFRCPDCGYEQDVAGNCPDHDQSALTLVLSKGRNPLEPPEVDGNEDILVDIPLTGLVFKKSVTPASGTTAVPAAVPGAAGAVPGAAGIPVVPPPQAK